MAQNPVKKLLSLTRELAYRKGEFTLSSGKKSDYYIDIKKVSLHSLGALLLGELIYNLVDIGRCDAIGGIEIGAVPLIAATCVIASQNNHHLDGLIVRKKIKKYGTAKLIDGSIYSGHRVLIVDDVVSAGKSVMRAVKAFREAELHVVSVVAVVDRDMGAKKLFLKEEIPYFSILDIKEIMNDSQREKKD